jgi:CopG family nickel-responsive transcriptional regulator
VAHAEHEAETEHREGRHGTLVARILEFVTWKAGSRPKQCRLSARNPRDNHAQNRYNPCMSEQLVRFGVAMEASLLEEFDRVVDEQGTTRSEALRDLARSAVVRAQIGKGKPAVAALTLVYDHHVRDLTERLTELQHELGEHVRSTMHVHIDHDNCMEVIIMTGRSDELQRVADRILGLRGVKHGGIEIVTGLGHGPHAHAHPHGMVPASRVGQSHASTRPRRRRPG